MNLQLTSKDLAIIERALSEYKTDNYEQSWQEDHKTLKKQFRSLLTQTYINNLNNIYISAKKTKEKNK